MLEIIMLLLAVMLAAKKPRRRRRAMGQYTKGNVDEALALGTLAAATLIGQAFGETAVEKCRISSIVATWALSEFTLGAGDGPISVGLAHSDYTDAEIEEVIEVTGSWDIGNKISRERMKRLVRHVGVFNTQITGEAAVLNDGNSIKTKLNWGLVTGDTLRFWAYNHGTSALAGTDPQLEVTGHANLWY